jgi:hypothetical protein
LEQAVQDHHTNNNGRAIAPVPDDSVDHAQPGRQSLSQLPPVTSSAPIAHPSARRSNRR